MSLVDRNIEGKPGEANLLAMPSDLFSKMTSLTFLHLGLHESLPHMASFAGAPNLKSISLALLLSLESLPSLATLTHLERLELLFLANLQAVDGLGALSHLSHVVIVDAPVCCNGKLGSCDVSHHVCTNAVCTPDAALTADAASLALVQQFSQTVCLAFLDSSAVLTASPSRDAVDRCGGVLYRQCALSASTNETAGICYNGRTQVISCVDAPVVVAIRREEIRRSVGAACDPVEEAWLGCTRA